MVLRCLLLLLFAFCFLLTGCAGEGAGTTSAAPKATGNSVPNNNALFYGLDNQNNILQAYFSANGHLKQSYSLANASDTLKIDNEVFYEAGDNLTSISLQNGKQLWSVPLSNPVALKPIIGENSVYTISQVNNIGDNPTFLIYAFNPRDGSLQWRNTFTFAIQAGQFSNDDKLTNDLLDGSTLYISTVYGAAAYNLASQKLLWYYNSNIAWFFSNLVFTPDAIYLQSTQVSGFFVLNPINGQLLWSYDGTKISNVSDPFHFLLAADDSIYAYDSTVLQELNNLTGATLWSINYLSLTNQEPIQNWLVNGDGLYLITGPGGGDILALNRSTGGKLWNNESTDSYQQVATLSGSIFVIGKNTLYAFDDRTGTMKWKISFSSLNIGSSVYTTSKSLYVTMTNLLTGNNIGDGLAKIDPGTGKVIWTIQSSVLLDTLVN